MKLLLVLMSLFVFISPALSFDLESSTKVTSTTGLSILTSREAYLKQYPQCANYESCIKVYNLLAVQLYKSATNEYFYRIVILDHSRAGQFPRRRVHLVSATIEVTAESDEPVDTAE